MKGKCLFAAITRGDFDALRTLITSENCNFVNEYDESVLIAAIRSYCKDEIVSLLLEHNADVTCKDTQGRTALVWATIRKSKWSTAIASLLIAAKSNVNHADRRGATPMHFAAENSSISIMDVLYKAGANLNCQDSDGETPLYWARGNGFVISKFLEFGAKKEDLEEWLKKKEERMGWDK